MILLVVGALLAFAGEEWRDARHKRERTSMAIASIRNELMLNRSLVAAARERHRHMLDTLSKLVARKTLPDVSLYSNGMWNPAVVTSTAWQMARETGALEDLPLPTVLEIARTYESQESYRGTTEALSTAIMNDVRRDGMLGVLRDQFAQFVPLDLDFSGRETRLMASYDKALKRLAEYR